MHFLKVYPLFFLSIIIPTLAVDWSDPDVQETCTCSSVSGNVCMNLVCQTAKAKLSCFPGSSQVTLCNGNMKSLSNVQIGDHVLAIDGTCEHILDFIHAKRDDEFPYLRIQTQNSTEPLLVSVDHLIFLFDKKDEAVFAGKLRVGDRLNRMIGNGRIIPAEIVDIQLTTSTGYYAPLTPSGKIVVDGILASNYAVVANHHVAHQTMSIYRLWISMFGPVSNVQQPQENVHWIMQSMESFARFPLITYLAGNKFFDGMIHSSTLLV